MFWNEVTGAVIGTLVAGVAWKLTGQAHWHDGDRRPPITDY
jgi:hypothetical protein